MRSALRRLNPFLPVIFGLPSLLLLFHSANIIRANIGFSHDELWDFTPAVGMIRADSLATAQEVSVFSAPVPLVSGPYQGALKAWIVAPFLQIFGTSPRLIISMNVLFSMTFLVLLYWALLPATGRLWASLVFATPFVDANFLLTGPMDTGPFLFQSMFISLAMGTLFRYMADRRRKHLWLTWLFAGGILAQKLTSIPIVLGFVILLGVLSYGRMRDMARLRGVRSAAVEHIGIPSALFLAPLIPHIAYFLKSGFADLFSMTADAERLSYLSALGKCISFFQSMSGGTDWYQRITLDNALYSEEPSLLAMFGAVATACFVTTFLFTGARRRSGRQSLIFLLLGLVSFLIYPLVPGLFRPWHFYILSPIFLGCCVTFTWYCYSRWMEKFGSHAWLLRSMLILGFASFVGFGVTHGAVLLRGIEDHRGVCQTSPAIFDIYGEIANAGIDRIYAVNYSLACPVYVLSKGKIKVVEMTWTELTPELMEEVIREVQSDPKTAIVYRYCECAAADQEWIRWLNRDPEIFAWIHRLERETGALEFLRRRDARLTEFTLVRRRRPLELQLLPK